MILYNGKIVTMDNYLKEAEAILIKNDKIEFVGTNDQILVHKTKDTTLIDLHGKLVIPGFNDSHMHLYGFGQGLQMVDLKNATSVKEIINRGKEFISSKEIRENAWVIGRGWNQDYFKGDKIFPTRFDLDEISTTNPIMLSRACGHLAVVNTKALEICGIDINTPQVDGGEFNFDLGLFSENAISLISANIPKPTKEEVKKALIDGMEYANKHGITSIQTDDLAHAGNYKLLIEAYESLRRAGKLTCRIYQQCLLDSKEKLKEFLDFGYNTGYGDNYYKLGPLKLLSDGSLGARTAALVNPYADNSKTNGIMCYSQAELDELIKLAHDNGMQISVHCIGDRAMYSVLNSYEIALKANNRKDHRHGIIHCQITDETLLNKFKELNVIAYVQPIFLHYDLHIVESRVGKELASKTYAFKSMIDKGIHTSFGTDCPVEALDTMSNVHCAVTRSDLSGYPKDGWNSKEKVSVYEAIYSYTMSSAYAAFEEDIKGSISKGKLADFIVLDEDIFKVDVNKIKDIKVEMTFVGGKLVYKK